MIKTLEYGAFTIMLAFTSVQEQMIEKMTPIIVEESQANGLEPELVAAVIQVESSWYPKAESEAGACGLMQVIPKWNPKPDGSLYTCDELKDPATNIKAGTAALARWMKRASGDRYLALCAYNAGNRCFKKMRMNYVNRVMNVYHTITRK
jgi:soluble lytic murein transglycosylase-like protein